MALEIAAIVIALCFVVLTAVLIPLILQLKKNALKMETSSDEINRQLPEILNNLRLSSDNARQASDQMKHGFLRASTLLESIGDFGEGLSYLSNGFRSKTKGLGSTVAGLAAGLNAFLKIFGSGKKETED
jgi:uncharacterized protein YoxC